MCLKASSHVCAKYSLISRSDCADSILPITLQHAHKGTGDGTKTNEFSEKFQTAFDPNPPQFRKIMLQFFPENVRKNLFKGPKSATKFFGLKMPLLSAPPLELFRKFIRFGTVTRP